MAEEDVTDGRQIDLGGEQAPDEAEPLSAPPVPRNTTRGRGIAPEHNTVAGVA